MDSLDNHNDMDKKKPIKLAKKTCLVRKRDLSEGQNMLSLLLEVARNVILKSLNNISDTLGLQPEWLEQIDSFMRPAANDNIEEGYVLYFDGANKRGHKTMIETDLNGNITHIVSFKR